MSTTSFMFLHNIRWPICAQNMCQSHIKLLLLRPPSCAQNKTLNKCQKLLTLLRYETVCCFRSVELHLWKFHLEPTIFYVFPLNLHLWYLYILQQHQSLINMPFYPLKTFKIDQTASYSSFVACYETAVSFLFTAYFQKF